MRKLLYLVVVLVAAVGCNDNDSADQKNIAHNLSLFGDTVSVEGAEPAEKLLNLMAGKDSLPVKLKGKILDVCQKKGCWMELDMGSGKSLRVTFKDYAFFVPKDVSGKTAIVDGYASLDTISVAQLKEYASDAKKSNEEIDAITAPEVELSFEARGVIIQN